MMSSVVAGGGDIVDTVAVDARAVGDREGYAVGRRLQTAWLSVALSLLSWRLIQHECSLLESSTKLMNRSPSLIYTQA